MTKRSRFFGKISQVHAVPYLILKLGVALIAQYTAILYIAMDMTYLSDYVYAHYIFSSSLESILISLVLLLSGVALLNRLFQKQT